MGFLRRESCKFRESYNFVEYFVFMLTQAELTIDLNAIASNWAWVRSQVAQDCDCGAVVKADAYGLGVREVAPVLAAAGCRSFYVSNLEEGFALQQLLGAMRAELRIFVLTGCVPGQELAFMQSGLIPVIISLEMYRRWSAACRANAAELSQCAAAIKVDTGMGRLGLDASELTSLLNAEPDLAQSRIKYLFSHLACADAPEHPLNRRQLRRLTQVLRELRHRMPDLLISLANSAGVLLGEAYHFDFVRPGIALYGGQPSAAKHCPLKTVLTLVLPVIQVKQLPAGESVGYGATRSWQSPRVIALAQSGYADGLLRSLSNSGSGVLLPSANRSAPLQVSVAGRVSMDTLIFDVTEAKETIEVGDAIEMLGRHKSLESLAQQANSLNYEILTALSGRYTRKYLRGDA